MLSSVAHAVSVLFDPTEPFSATEHNKSKYEATGSHEFGVVQPYRTSLNNITQSKYQATNTHEFAIGVVRTTSSHEFGVV